MSVTLPFGVDFRATSGYVSDPANTVPEIGTNVDYSSGRGYGWETLLTAGSLSTRDRSAGVDARLAGIHGYSNGITNEYGDFRIDLPAAGSVNLRLAIGDASNAQPHNWIKVYDGSTLLATIVSDVATLAGEFYDATGVKRTSASDWVTNNAARSLTFATTIMRIRVGPGPSGGSNSGSSSLAHVDLATSGATHLGPYHGTLTVVGDIVDEFGVRGGASDDTATLVPIVF